MLLFAITTGVASQNHFKCCIQKYKQYTCIKKLSQIQACVLKRKGISEMMF